ncbi:MAG: FMN-binding protein [Clostridiales bacterium]|nr:FMN-binding protein [Clostridiales bacterium]
MKRFWIRACNLIVIAAALLGYNQVAKAHEAENAAAKAEADVINAEAEAAIAAMAAADGEEAAATYHDGVYQGTATGFGGDIIVEVTIEDGVITDLTVVSAEKEDSAYLTMAEEITDDILEAQSADVDTISGATFSSTGIRDAAAAALEEACQD